MQGACEPAEQVRFATPRFTVNQKRRRTAALSHVLDPFRQRSNTSPWISGTSVRVASHGLATMVSRNGFTRGAHFQQSRAMWTGFQALRQTSGRLGSPSYIR